MRRILLSIAYDGTKYCGFQLQPNGVSITKVITDALVKIANHPITLVGASRTDSGVHAKGQAATFDLDCSIPTKQIPRALSGLLPDDIVVFDAREVEPDFQVQRRAVGKHYRYTIRNHALTDPFDHRYTFHFDLPLDTEKMVIAAAPLIGEHDFRGFCAAHSGRKNFIRTVDRITINRQEPYIYLDFFGRGFLYKMVRRISGYLIDAGRDFLPVDLGATVLQHGNGDLLRLTAPSCGLCLERVYFEEELYKQALKGDAFHG